VKSAGPCKTPTRSSHVAEFAMQFGASIFEGSNAEEFWDAYGLRGKWIQA
jgi:hypothetical protein